MQATVEIFFQHKFEYLQKSLIASPMPMSIQEGLKKNVKIYSGLHRNSPFARFLKSDVALAWLNKKFSSMAHMKQLSANFHLIIQKFQKSQGY